MEVFGPAISFDQFDSGDEIGTASPILICAWDLVKHSACCLTKKSKLVISFPWLGDRKGIRPVKRTEFCDGFS